MLAQFALIVFAMCAVMSLVIDVGYARLTQSQMQNAADTAALEGLRKRDVIAGDPDASDLQRRMAARDVVRWVFDDDLNPENGDPDQFGAGPIIDLTEGVTNLRALATMSVPDAHVYKPDLQLNQQDEVYGDMLSGSFSYSADPAPSEDVGYARNDFDLGNRAFLVRLRRSHERQDLPDHTEPSVASNGPSLPLLFGRGTTILGDDPSSTYSVRRDGLTVRATAIAETRPALRVGLPQSQANPLLPGVTPFALMDTCVQSATGAPMTMTVTVNPATGLITRSSPGPVTCPAGAVVGRFVDNLNDPTRRRWKLINTVGQPLPAAMAVQCAATDALAAYGPVYYVPVFSSISGTNRIIGFARIGLARNACPAVVGTPFGATISRATSLVAPSNATANLFDGLPLPADATPADVRELLDKNCPAQLPECSDRARVVVGVNYGPVLVPVLAR